MNIQTHELTKKYTLKTALENVSVTFQQGKIHALVGENGAGKSTLAAILAGDIPPTSGTICLDNKPVIFKSAKDSLNAGINLVHQRPLLATKLTAKENIILKLPKLIYSKKESLYQLKDKWAPELNLDSYIKDLGGNMRFYVSLIGALLRNPKCLILDEPSAFLDQEERKTLYKNLRELSSSGTTIIVITHSTEEAISYTDTVTLLKEGNLVRQFNSAQEYKMFIAEQNIQSSTSVDIYKDSDAKSCLEIIHASSRPKNRPALLDVSIKVNYGQITSVLGLKEAASDTLEDLITGMEISYSKGKAVFTSPEGKVTELNFARGQYNTSFLRLHKCAIIPSDKTFRASNPALTIEQMMSVYEKKVSAKKIDDLIRKANVNITQKESARNLSGGMLQRLILERELSINPDIIIMCNPMHGLDIQAQTALCKRLTALAEQGKAILIIGAADFPLSLCHNIYRLEGGITRHE